MWLAENDHLLFLHSWRSMERWCKGLLENDYVFYLANVPRREGRSMGR